MQYQIKEATDDTFFIILLDDTDFVTPITGKTAADITVKYSKGGGDLWTTYTATGKFNEIGNGVYSLVIGESEFTTNSRYVARVSCTGALDYKFVVKAMDYSDYELEKTIRRGR